MSPRFYVILDYAGGITLSTVGGCKRHLNAAAVSNITAVLYQMP